jgi:polysaccharide pyruvyl transferase WcaK-like protein
LAIAGYYGFGNVGDDAILEGLLGDLHREFPGAAFQIIGANCSAGPPLNLGLFQ